jgi:hypothetical protein
VDTVPSTLTHTNRAVSTPNLSAPSQRASRIWLRKAMTAETMRIKSAMAAPAV